MCIKKLATSDTGLQRKAAIMMIAACLAVPCTFIATDASAVTTTETAGENTVKLTGKIIDQNGAPLPGAFMQVGNDLSAVTMSDLDGNFTMKAPVGSIVRISSSDTTHTSST